MEECLEIIVSAGIQASVKMSIATVILSIWTCVGWDMLHFKKITVHDNCEDWSKVSEAK